MVISSWSERYMITPYIRPAAQRNPTLLKMEARIRRGKRGRFWLSNSQYFRGDSVDHRVASAWALALPHMGKHDVPCFVTGRPIDRRAQTGGSVRSRFAIQFLCRKSLLALNHRPCITRAAMQKGSRRGPDVASTGDE